MARRLIRAHLVYARTVGRNAKEMRAHLVEKVSQEPLSAPYFDPLLAAIDTHVQAVTHGKDASNRDEYLMMAMQAIGLEPSYEIAAHQTFVNRVNAIRESEDPLPEVATSLSWTALFEKDGKSDRYMKQAALPEAELLGKAGNRRGITKAEFLQEADSILDAWERLTSSADLPTDAAAREWSLLDRIDAMLTLLPYSYPEKGETSWDFVQRVAGTYLDRYPTVKPEMTALLERVLANLNVRDVSSADLIASARKAVQALKNKEARPTPDQLFHAGRARLRAIIDEIRANPTPLQGADKNAFWRTRFTDLAEYGAVSRYMPYLMEAASQSKTDSHTFVGFADSIFDAVDLINHPAPDTADADTALQTARAKTILMGFDYRLYSPAAYKQGLESAMESRQIPAHIYRPVLDDLEASIARDEKKMSDYRKTESTPPQAAALSPKDYLRLLRQTLGMDATYRTLARQALGTYIQTIVQEGKYPNSFELENVTDNPWLKAELYKIFPLFRKAVSLTLKEKVLDPSASQIKDINTVSRAIAALEKPVLSDADLDLIARDRLNAGLALMPFTPYAYRDGMMDKIQILKTSLGQRFPELTDRIQCLGRHSHENDLERKKFGP